MAKTPDQDDILDSALNSVLNPNLDALYEATGKKYNINPLWLKAQDQHEVGNLAKGDGAVGDAEHVGHGQIGPVWRQSLGLDERPTAAAAIDGMGKILRTLLDKHGGDIGQAQLEYTGGPDMKKWGPKTLAYPEAVAKNYNALGGKAGQIAYPGGQDDVLGDALETIAMPKGSAPAAPPERPTGWNAVDQLGNAVLLGGGKAVEAAGRASGRVLNSLEAGAPLGYALGRFPYLYNQAKDELSTDKKSYEAENPGTALTADVAGSLPLTTGAIMLGQDYAVAPAARAVSALGPRAAGVVNALTGGVRNAAGELVGNVLTRGASRIVPGATAGATAGVLQSGMNDESTAEQGKTGAVVGALLGPTFGSAADVLSSHIAPRVADMANRLIKRGVPLSPGQIPGVSSILNFLHSKLGDAGGSQARAGLTAALTRSFGENAPEITNDVLEQAQRRIGETYERFGNATINKDQPLKDQIIDVLANAHGDIGEGTGIPEDKLKQLRDAAGLIANAGTEASMSGKTFLALTKRGSTLDRLMLDPDVGHHAGQLRDALTGALERSVSAANGQWVPAGEAAAQRAAAPLGRLVGLPTNKLIGTGSAGDIRLPQNADGTTVVPFSKVGGFAQEPPLRGTPETPPGPPPAPGMVWQVDPATQNALADLRTANGQYKNLKLVSGIADPVTGEVNPTALAKRVQRFYPPSAKRPMTEAEQHMQDLANAKLFIPPGATAAKAPNKLVKTIQNMSHGLVAGGAALGGEQIIQHFASDPTALVAGLGLGALGLGAAKGTTSLLDSPLNARRIIAEALSRDPSGHTLSNALFVPPVVSLYNHKDTKK